MSNHSQPDDAQLDSFLQARGRLFALAYRMLGSVMDAEDVLQDAYLRWQNAAIDQQIRSPEAFLTTLVTRQCIDVLRSGRIQRQEYIGPWLPAPLLTADTDEPADVAEADETLTFAFLLLLERLGPVERAIFLLRDVFDFDYAEVAAIVGKSEANCRQIARRARLAIADERTRFMPSAQHQRLLLTRFLAACQHGDLDSLLAVLKADAEMIADSGGKATAARQVIHGASNVARLMLGLIRHAPPNTTSALGQLNSAPALIVCLDGHIFAVLIIEMEQTQIRRIFNVVNPDKLRHLPCPARSQPLIREGDRS